jgi:hypothetical protein
MSEFLAIAVQVTPSGVIISAKPDPSEVVSRFTIMLDQDKPCQALVMVAGYWLGLEQPGLASGQSLRGQTVGGLRGRATLPVANGRGGFPIRTLQPIQAVQVSEWVEK